LVIEFSKYLIPNVIIYMQKLYIDSRKAAVGVNGFLPSTGKVIIGGAKYTIWAETTWI
jgi:hypothetical protein